MNRATSPEALSALLTPPLVRVLSEEEFAALASGDALARALFRYAGDGDFAAFCGTLRERFDYAWGWDETAPQLREYVDATLRVREVRGPFVLRGIAAALADPAAFSPALRVDPHGDASFPALRIGHDGAGTNFWMLLPWIDRRNIIPVRSGAPLAEHIATLQRGAPLDIVQLLRLQAALFSAGWTEPGAGAGTPDAACEAFVEVMALPEPEVAELLENPSMSFMVPLLVPPRAPALDEVIAFIREFMALEQEVAGAGSERAVEAASEALLRFVAASGTPGGAEAWWLAPPAGSAAPRTLLQVRRYLHPIHGNLYRAYFDSPGPLPDGTASFDNLYIADGGDGLRMISRYTMEADDPEGGELRDGGVGWNWRGGVRLRALGVLAEVRKLGPPVGAVPTASAPHWSSP